MPIHSYILSFSLHRVIGNELRSSTRETLAALMVASMMTTIAWSDVSVDFRTASSWWGGYSGRVIITNNGPTDVHGWVLTWEDGPAIDTSWNVALASSEASHEATDVGWNARLPVGGHVEFGFTASGSLEANVRSCFLNGIAAAVTCDGVLVASGSPSAPGSGGESSPDPSGEQDDDPGVPSGEQVDSDSVAGSALSWSIQADSIWDSGFTATITISNDSTATVNGWTVQWSGGPAIASLWNGVMSTSSGLTTVSDAGWNQDIAPGASVTIGFSGQGHFDASSFRDVSFESGAVAIPPSGGGTGSAGEESGAEPDAPAEPVVPADPIDPPPTDAIVTTPAPEWPDRFFAPYVDVTLWPAPHLPTLMNSAGARFFTAAFVVAMQGQSCDGSWGGYSPYTPDQGFMVEQLDDLRAQGGDIMLSFGGAAGTELAAACGTAEDLAKAYQSIIDAYQLTHIDFDIEGAWVAHPSSIERRSIAIRLLQDWARDAGRALHVWYTLPVLPQGLTWDGLNVLESALAWGVELDGVNIMAMDYGANAAPPAAASMGEYAILAAQSVHSQLGQLYASYGEPRSIQDLWSMVGVTPMIGQNDVAGEVFTVDDAALLRSFAAEEGVGMLSMWSITRDHPCPGGPSPWASASCSGINQAAFEFAWTLGADRP